MPMNRTECKALKSRLQEAYAATVRLLMDEKVCRDNLQDDPKLRDKVDKAGAMLAQVQYALACNLTELGIDLSEFSPMLDDEDTVCNCTNDHCHMMLNELQYVLCDKCKAAICPACYDGFDGLCIDCFHDQCKSKPSATDHT